MKTKKKNTKGRTAYYMVRESFFIKTADGSRSLFSRELFFKKDNLLQRRSDALDYCANRMNEIELRNLGEEPSIEEERAAYRNLDEGWIPLPGVVEEFKDVEIRCSFIIEEDGAQLHTVILHTDPEYYFFLFGLADEADYLRNNA